MIIKDLLSEKKYNLNENDLSKIVLGITDDSKMVNQNFIFFSKSNSKKIDYINEAIQKGCILIISDITIDLVLDIPIIVEKDLQTLKLTILKKFYNQLPKNVVAVTGTNGKTSVASFYYQIARLLGKNSCTIGTNGTLISQNNQYNIQTYLTTPNLSFLLHNFHYNKIKYNTDYVAIEASSHALDQKRIHGLKINIAILTNITHDHLDYHKNYNNYFNAKIKLFTECLDKKNGIAIINNDLEYSSKILDILDKDNINYKTIGFKGDFISIKEIIILNNKQCQVIFSFDNQEYNFNTHLIGDFQIYNLISAIGAMILSGDNILDILSIIPNIKSVSGRLEYVSSYNQGDIYIDYAHTPDALYHLINSIRKYTKGKVYVIIGCGGNRDIKKRKMIGNITSKYADFVIVTDDNPRYEDPASIRNQIIEGISTNNYINIEGRDNAIKYALLQIQQNDVLLIAGKGHETYQEIKGVKSNFSDYSFVINSIKN